MSHHEPEEPRPGHQIPPAGACRAGKAEAHIPLGFTGDFVKNCYFRAKKGWRFETSEGGYSFDKAQLTDLSSRSASAGGLERDCVRGPAGDLASEFFGLFDK